MLFNSLEFLVFAIIFFSVYFLLKDISRLVFIVLSSYLFYGWWDYRFLSLILASTLVDFYIGQRIANTSESEKRRHLLYLSLLSNLGILGVFKYFDFFSASLENGLSAIGIEASLPLLNVILPVGISFYTFQTLSYTIDIYRKQIHPEPSLIRFSAYVSLFPQLVAGPIVRASTLLPQLHTDHSFDYERFGKGLELVIWGFFLKLCLADNLGPVVAMRFDQPHMYGSLSHIIGIIFFSFQIYGDFAGYSLIAIGLGKMMGLDFGINFNRPYFSKSFSEFWTRWHISLSTWLRDYLYISLGGNRSGKYKTFRNLILTMALGGLWHGAGGNFIVWGLLHGGYLVGQRLLSPYYDLFTKTLRLPAIVSGAILILIVFILTNVAWIYFRADSLEQANTILSIILSFDNMTLKGDNALVAIARGSVIILIVLAIDWISIYKGIKQFYYERVWMRILSMCILLWSISFIGSFSESQFIYFQF